MAFCPAVMLLVAMAACSQGESPTPSVMPTQPAVPSATPTPPPFALLMAPEPLATEAGKRAAQAVEEFAAQQGWQILRVTPGDDILGGRSASGLRLAAVVEADLGPALASAAQAHPEIRFVAAEAGGTEPLPNLLVVGGENLRREQAAFMAGLLATIENRNDYVGWIGEANTDRGKIYRNGFRHGVRYLCPRCRIFTLEIAAGADPSAGTTAAADLLTNYIDTASAMPGTAWDEGLHHLARNGVRIAGARPDFYLAVFGNGTREGAKSVLGEIAFRPDILLKDLLPRFLGGEAFAEAVPYSLENGGLEYAPFPNEWISAARQEYLIKILAEVAAGRLDIGVDPLTGDEI